LAIAILVLLSFLIFGAATNLGWYDRCVAPYLSGVVGAFNVQSIDAFLLRLGTGETLLWDWDPVEVSLAHRVSRYLIVGSMPAAAPLLMWRANRRKQPLATTDMSTVAALEFVLVLNLALVTSPLSWVHYYLLLLVPAALLVGGRLPADSDPPATRWLVYGGLMLASMPVAIPDLDEIPLGPLVARSAVSVWLLGGLLMLGGLMRAAWLDFSRERS
jgi:hypothetical protein